MQFNRLYSAIARGTWYLSPQQASAYIPLIEAMQEGRWPDARPAGRRVRVSEKDDHDARNEHDDARPLSAFGVDGEYYEDPWYYDFVPLLTAQGVLVVPVIDVLTRYDYCGVPGTSTIAQWLNRAALDEKVKGVLLLLDTPGGSVDGTVQLAQVVSNFPKYLESQVEGMMCSGGQFVGCPANGGVYASHAMDIVGSIGVVCSWTDLRGAKEKIGAKVHEIYADTSPNKNIEFREANKGNYKPIRQMLLNPMDEAFMAWVKQHRPDVSEDALTGQTYLAQEALNHGLLDGIRTLDQAIASVAAKVADQESANQSSTMQKPTSLIGRVAAAIGLNPTPSTETTTEVVATAETDATNATGDAQTGDEDPTATAQPAEGEATEPTTEVVTPEQQVQALTGQVATLTGERDAAVLARQAAEQERDQALARVQELEQEATQRQADAEAEAQAEPPAPATAPTTAAKPEGETVKTVAAAAATVAEMPHIREARQKMGLD